MRHVEAAALVRGREKFGRGDKMYLGVCACSGRVDRGKNKARVSSSRLTVESD